MVLPSSIIEPAFTSMSPRMLLYVGELLATFTTGTAGNPAVEPRPVVKMIICAQWRVIGYLLGNHGMSAETFFMCSWYPGLLSKLLLSIMGILTMRKSIVSATGPTNTHQ